MSRPVTRAARAAGCALLSFGAACFQYRAASPAGLPAGAHAAVALTDSGAVLLAPTVGPRAARLEGRLVAAEPSAVTMAVSTIVRARDQAESWPRESVRVPMTAVRQFQVRRLDGPRSALLAGALLAGLVTTRAVIEANSGSGGVKGSRPPTGQ